MMKFTLKKIYEFSKLLTKKKVNLYFREHYHYLNIYSRLPSLQRLKENEQKKKKKKLT